MKKLVINEILDLQSRQCQPQNKTPIPFMLIQQNEDPICFSVAISGTFVKSPFILISSIKQSHVMVEVLAPIRDVLLRTKAIVVLNLSNIYRIQTVTNPVYDTLELCKPFEQIISTPFSLLEDDCHVIWKALLNRNEDEATITVSFQGNAEDVTVWLCTNKGTFSLVVRNGETSTINVNDLLTISLSSEVHPIDGVIDIQIKSLHYDTICFL
ncbi:S-Ena type endospore appendage [Sporosarcina obsidiansis]|uniref:S-Ena type endospore appendage n=1 Tax=Sporosarcina obsidiansis TaxID=2660748 RepID=UPI00129A1D96|nr:S-Ena type endospore appendage [Sporosarcina obsidiansis]